MSQTKMSVLEAQLTSLKSFIAGLHSLAESASLPNRSTLVLVDAIVAEVEEACSKTAVDSSQVTGGEIEKRTFEDVVMLPLKEIADALQGTLKKAAESLQDEAGQHAETLRDKVLSGANANVADVELMARSAAAKTLHDVAPSFEMHCASCLEALLVVRINNVAAELKKRGS